MSLRVAWISHCPVKGLAVRQLDQCELTEAGIAGDREFFAFPDGATVSQEVRFDGSLGAWFWGQVRVGDTVELV